MKIFNGSLCLTGNDLIHQEQMRKQYGDKANKAISLSKKPHVVYSVMVLGGENPFAKYFLKPMKEKQYKRFTKAVYKIYPTADIFTAHASGNAKK
ncbi:MAG: hypothetical protein FWD48_11085 [Oscillospiraceae bacterium]|nr:hypothetical protein [Oscillospiraceae bacterium]